jgi:hypothetical protein
MDGVRWIHLGQEQVANSCENGAGSLASIKREIFLIG